MTAAPAAGRPQPVFIVGCRRSGTTLVSRIVDAHSAFAVYHESFLYPIFGSELRWYGDLGDGANLARLVDDVREVLGTQISDVPDAATIRRTLSHPSLSGVFEALLQLHARRHGKRRGGDKTPEHHRYVPDILRDLPGSPIVFTMRDPRDTVLSIRRVFNTSVEGAAHVWRHAFESYHAQAHRVRLLRYEALVGFPEDTVRTLCEAVGEPFESGMLEFHRHLPDGFRRRGGEKLAGPVDPGSVGLFQSMPTRDLHVIEAICGEGMEVMGYERVAGGRPGDAPGPAPRPRRWRWVWDRLRYYGTNGERWRRGAARWKVMARVRVRWLLRGAGRGA
jgi:hypothetical protein